MESRRSLKVVLLKSEMPRCGFWADLYFTEENDTRFPEMNEDDEQDPSWT